jgi:inositol phosphorylceramide mannosyltransferase catalytic subunit
LRTYDRYRYPVQRVDAVRYFLLLHYGGIYLDLDNGCKGDLTPLLYYPMWITDPGRGALSNNILASRPHHPFWARLTHSLIPWSYDWFFPYATISYASGQWFESAIWEEYHSLLPPVDENSKHDHRLHRLMMDDREGADESVFFTQERGGTWVNWDNYLFLQIGDHLFLFLLLLLGTISAAIWLVVKGLRRYRGYSRLKNQPNRYTI